jgi:outer membrane murein-binding lipoprotein Lpp
MPELPLILAEHLPELILGLIFLYALIALLLTALLVMARIMRTRARLTGVTTRDQLLSVVAQTGLKRLGLQIVDPAPSERNAARREIGHLYRDRLVRVHFFTGVAGLLAIAALGWIKDYLHITEIEIAVPAGLAFVAALVLVLLFTLGQLAIGAAAASLLDRISELSFGSVSGHTLLIAAEGDRVSTNAVTSSFTSPVEAIAPIVDAIEGLIEVMDHGRNSIREPMMQLSASAEALAAMAKAISERPTDAAPAASHAAIGEQLETAIDRLAVKIEQIAERPIGAAPAAAYAAIGEQLETAIDRLTAKIEQIAERRTDAAPTAAYAAIAEQLETAIDRLTAKIEQLSAYPTDAAAATSYAATGEELKTAIDRLTAKIEQLSERPTDAAPTAAYAAIGEQVETAIDRLTAKIEQLADTPTAAAPVVANTKSQRSEVPRGLEELRDLLKEFE